MKARFSALTKCVVAYHWGAGERKGYICFCAHFLEEGEKESVIANKLVFSVRADKYMRIYVREISKQALSDV